MTTVPASSSGEEEYQDFAALLDSYYEFDQLQRGDIRDAVIMEASKSEIIVDLGVKRDGIVPAQDMERIPPALLRTLRVGVTVPVYILNPNDRNGNLVVSINLALQGQDWAKADALLTSGEVVECRVTGFNKGGLLVQFEALEGFVPSSHLVDVPPDLAEGTHATIASRRIGEPLSLKVIEVDQRRRRLILSQREAQRETRIEHKQRLLNELKVGDIVEGRVTGIRDFGAFVNIGGADGLIHVSEMAWYRVGHPGDLLKLGDAISVYVLELDHERQRIALSLRRTIPDPWNTVEQVYTLGQRVAGQVTNVRDYGAFVVLPGGIEGLLHVTEMRDGTVTEPYSYVQRGDPVEVEIVLIDPPNKRIGFTQKSLQPGAEGFSVESSARIYMD